MSWTPEALAGALGVLATAMAGVALLMARTYVQVANILQGLHRAGVPMRGGQGAATLASSSSVTSPATRPLARPALWAPRWDQNNDRLPDGSLDRYSSTDCGEECVAEVVYAVRGVPLTAGDVRYLLGGAQRIGTTSGRDLVQALAVCHIPAKSVDLDSTAAQASVLGVFQDGRFSVALGEWVTPGMLHWVLIRRADATGILFNDPWGGRQRSLTWQDFQRLYKGVLVDVMERPAYTS